MSPTLLRRAAPLSLLWLAAALPLLAYAALYRTSVGAILGLVGQLGLACLLALLPLPRRALTRGLLAALALLVAGGVAERELSKHGWQSSDKAGLVSALQNVSGGGDEVSSYGFRNWDAAGVDAATLRFDVRLVSGQPAWDWFRSDSGFVLEPQPGLDYPHTRVRVPEDGPGTGQPYLMRTFDVGEPLGGRIFRAVLDLRRAPKNTSTHATPPAPAAATIEPGSPIGGRDCHGVSLQAWSYRGGGRCLPVTLTESWQRYSLSWRVPSEVKASVVRLVLSGLAEETFDVRRVRLFSPRGELGPLLPQGGAVQLAWGRRPEAHSGKSFPLTPDWQTVTARATRALGDTLTTTLYTAGGLVLETRGVAITAPDGTPLPPAAGSTRQTILFGDPNLAGHTLGTLGLALVSLASPPLGLGGGALTLLGVGLTGSRAALIGVAFGFLWLVWLRLPEGRRRVGFTVLGVVLAGFVGTAWSALSGLRLFSLGETTARSDIWRAAWEAFLAYPWQGLGAGGFSAYWAEQRGGEAVQHAHNLWLEFAASYGVLGLASVLALTLGLSLLAWRWGGGRALALTAGVLVMNLFDTTFFYSGVLFTLLLGLGAFGTLRPNLGTSKPDTLKSNPYPLHTAAGRGAHNAEVAASRLPQVPPE